MVFQDLPIKQKVVSVIMLTSISALILMAAAFMIYDALNYRKSLEQHLRTTAAIIGDTTTAYLEFASEKEAQAVLNSLRADAEIKAAALYDENGNLLVRYPQSEPIAAFPIHPPGRSRVSRNPNDLIVFQPAVQAGRPVGTVYLRSDLNLAFRRLRLHAEITLAVILGATLLAFIISNYLQQRITNPVLSLAQSVKTVSERGDYSVRAGKQSGDELGMLADSFNSMLERIQEQTQQLRDNEERLRLALESSRTATWDWNLKTNQVSWDDLMHDFFGLEKTGFNGTFAGFLERVHSEDRDKVKRALDDAINKKEPANLEYRILWPDGSIHHLVSRGRAVYSESGEPVRMTGVTLDVTERRQAEEIRAFLAAIVNSSDDAVIGKNLESRVVSWNLGAERMFGYTAAEMLGQPITRLISPDRPEEETTIIGEARRGKMHHVQTVRLRKDGQAIDVSLTVSPIRNARGEIIGVSSIARDITEAVRARAALERHATVLREQAQMLDLANVLARDLEDRIILWNTGMQNMYGWTKAEAVGRISHELFRTSSPVPLEKIRATLFRKGHWKGELRHARKDGREIIVASEWVLHLDAEGKPAAILEINNDVTERRRAEDEVRRMNSELEERVHSRTSELRAANQEMEAFTYSVAHDLRAPLRHIDAFSRILDEDFGEKLPTQAKKYLENIRQGSRNMSQLVDDLLNLAKVGRQELKRHPTPLNIVVSEVKAELDRETTGRQIHWHIDPLPVIECDAGLMKQVFTNLLSNAVKYTRPRRVAEIEVGTRSFNGETAVFVRDNGVGFSMKYVDKLFGVFQRLHRQEEFEGTGVGLATVERIVRKHGGRVWAEATVDKGATFYFTTSDLRKGNGGGAPG